MYSKEGIKIDLIWFSRFRSKKFRLAVSLYPKNKINIRLGYLPAITLIHYDLKTLSCLLKQQANWWKLKQLFKHLEDNVYSVRKLQVASRYNVFTSQWKI